MQYNHVPRVSKVNLTGCCPKFEPKGWDQQTFVFRNKRFVRFTNYNLFYFPLNLSRNLVRTMKTVAEAGADDHDEHLMLSLDTSPWKTEHLLAVTKDVPGMENIRVSGTFLARVFEGPYSDTPKWMSTMQNYVAAKKKKAEKIYMNYTTCPACSKFYGKNYVVAFAKIT